MAMARTPASGVPLLAIFFRRGSERFVILFGLRRRGEDQQVGGDGLVQEALLVGAGEMDFLAAVLGPDLLRVLDVLRRPAIRMLVGLAHFLAPDLLQIRPERLPEVAVAERARR